MEINELKVVSTDVCKTLEYSNETSSLDMLDDDEKAKFDLGLPGGDTDCVDEAGLYTLALFSREPVGRAFKRWIVHDVIPSIRKHGAYMTTETVEMMLSDPDFEIYLAVELKEEQQKRTVLETENEDLAVQLLQLVDEITHKLQNPD